MPLALDHERERIVAADVGRLLVRCRQKFDAAPHLDARSSSQQLEYSGVDLRTRPMPEMPEPLVPFAADLTDVIALRCEPDHRRDESRAGEVIIKLVALLVVPAHEDRLPKPVQGGVRAVESGPLCQRQKGLRVQKQAEPACFSRLIREPSLGQEALHAVKRVGKQGIDVGCRLDLIHRQILPGKMVRATARYTLICHRTLEHFKR